MFTLMFAAMRRCRYADSWRHITLLLTLLLIFTMRYVVLFIC